MVLVAGLLLASLILKVLSPAPLPFSRKWLYVLALTGLISIALACQQLAIETAFPFLYKVCSAAGLSI